MPVLARIVLALLPAIASAQTPFIPLNGQIWDGHGGPLQTGLVYHVIGNGASCGISVPAGQTLTIQHGAIVKIGGCVGAMVEASTATVQDCEFRDFADVPVRGLSRISLPLFTNNRALRCTAGDYALVQYMGLLTSNLAIDRSHSMNGNGVFVFDLL